MSEAVYSRPISTGEAVVRELRHHIGAGTFRPGERLVTHQVAARLAVSNQPVREALRTLEAEGRVEYERHKGYTVTALSNADLLEVYRLRDLLEDEASVQSMMLFPDERFEELEALCTVFSRAADGTDPKAVRRANRELHALLRAYNPYRRLDEVVEQLRAVSAPYRAKFLEQRLDWRDLAAEHISLVETFRAKDEAAFVQISRAHRQRTITAMLDAGARGM